MHSGTRWILASASTMDMSKDLLPQLEEVIRGDAVGSLHLVSEPPLNHVLDGYILHVRADGLLQKVQRAEVPLDAHAKMNPHEIQENLDAGIRLVYLERRQERRETEWVVMPVGIENKNKK